MILVAKKWPNLKTWSNVAYSFLETGTLNKYV